MIDPFQHVTTESSVFERQLLRLANIVEGDATALYKKAAIDLVLRIAERNPVDTGLSKGSWNIGMSADELSNYLGGESLSDKEVSKDRMDALRERNSSKAMDAVAENTKNFEFAFDGRTIWIYNYTKYIEPLENGTSKQAPEGMVAVSLQDFSVHWKREAAKLRSFK